MSSSGAWTSRDLISKTFRFCCNDPLNSYDFLGLDRMLTFARRRPVKPVRTAGQHRIAREVMRKIEEMNKQKGKSGCPCFDIQIKDLVTTPLESVRKDIAEYKDRLYVIAHGGLMVNGKVWSGGGKYYWRHGDEVVEFLDYRHDNSGKYYTLDDLSGIKEDNILACYFTLGHRKVYDPRSKMRVSSVSQQSANLRILLDELEKMESSNRGCDKTVSVMIYEGERTNGNRSYSTERALKDALREESFYEYTIVF